MFRSQLGKFLVAFVMTWPALVQAQSALTTAVQPFVDRQELAGAVMLVANKEKVLAAEAVGWADVAAKSPMRTDSLFWIASQSKPITGAAVMLLVDEGKISLDDPIDKYLPEFKGLMYVAEKTDEQKVLKKVPSMPTVRHVLSHTSGMPFKSALEEPTLDLYPLHTRVKSYAMTPLDFAPTTKYQYSNAGINTAARIIEVVEQMPFEDFLEKRFFIPLGMIATKFVPDKLNLDLLAKAYKPGPDNKGLVETSISQLHYPLNDEFIRYPMPAGGLFSTARDLARFYQMLLNGGELDGQRYLSTAAIKELTRRQTPETVKESYSLGFSVSPTTFGHGGAYSTNTVAETDTGLIYVWLVQHAGFPGEGGKSQDAFRKAARMMFAPPKP